MTFAKRIAGAVALGMGMLIGSGLSAQAGYVVTLEQQGPNVVATGSGPIDLTGLHLTNGSGSSGAAMIPSSGTITTGPRGLTDSRVYTGFTGPTSFGSGTGSIVIPDSGSGDIVGIGALLSFMVVPRTYVSDSALSDTATYDNDTFRSLGVTPGTYEWTWGTAANQNFTLDVVVPEPSSLLLLGVALVILMIVLPPRTSTIPG